MRKTILAFCLFLTACVGVPDGITPVSTVDAGRYDGLWYEVARLDNRFERGLSNVTAEYALREDGGLTVINRGYKDKSGKWEQAKGMHSSAPADASDGRLTEGSGELGQGRETPLATGVPAAQVRLSAAVYPAEARGLGRELEVALPQGMISGS